ncbi:multidrug ABC transporter ATPase [Metasolibacillus meyeri]|uniref:Multidrug ABC transporter ATPase n=1 Tax=Metasolibacillus meyeri TaxID=1071052 RepID=A0AAW9NF30_9BACL|nr:multidrug ABC transporter ATPase [Metasolibacillus meyeri]MEC1176974.1 multidrug ABC transporter ATPase [Metasolibacillus meyeri]
MEKNNQQPRSGQMVNNMEDLKQLGKQMENMRDGQQLEENDRIVDPQQFDKIEDRNENSQ